MKIICLGNEFIKKDSLAKEVAMRLKEEIDIEIEFIKDSFELLNYISEELIVLDVVQDLNEVREIAKEDLRTESINTGHDFDASFFMQLLDMDVRIIGLPQEGNVDSLKEEVKKML